MNQLTQDRRLVLYDADGAAYRPVRDGGTGRSVFKIKPKGASNLAADAIHTEEWLEVARAVLIEGLAARCQALSGGQINYLRFGAQKLIRYELDPELALALGIPAEGTASDVVPQEGTSLQALLDLLSRKEIDAAMRECDQSGLQAFLTSRGFVRPQVWVRSASADQAYPAKATVVAALGYLPNGLALSAKQFFNGFGENQAFGTLERLGYEVLRDDDGSNFGHFARTEIEAAMDAFDAFQDTGVNSEIFASFGEPRDYWVSSTRERPNRVYPTKPLVGYILKQVELNGGWGKKTDAAARLHNAGFIIVDRDGIPIAPPENAGHLLRDADRIRRCALNYFVEPAREGGAASVSIRAGDLAQAMGLKDAFPNICQALGGVKFQQLANLSAPTHSEPNPSSSTTFTFQLRSNAETHVVTDANTSKEPSTANLILYGPPGTGKTYTTAWEAVRLCIGDNAAARLQGKESRNALMEEYRRLASEGRIEFVTFHQSLSYEEFVEGLRPMTGETLTDGAEEGETRGGFRLVPHDGVFKRISERARLDTGGDGAVRRLDRSRNIFKIALGRRSSQEDRIEYGLRNNVIHIGWGDTVDWSDERYESWEEIRKTLEEVQGEAVSPYSGDLVCTYSFRTDLQIGDYVVVSDGRDRFRALGVVVGDYFFDKDAPFHPHRRQVDWLWADDSGVDRAKFYPKGFRRHSFYKLDDGAVDWDGLESLVLRQDAVRPTRGARDFVLIIDEINRANISKVFGELITLLEPDKRLGAENEVRLQLPYSKKQFGVPSNLHIVGTMNTADRSIALLDTALRRRFTFRELMPDPKVLSPNVEGINLQSLLATINDRIEYLFDREHQVGHAYFSGCKNASNVEEVVRYKVIPLLAEYFYEDWAKVAAVLGDAANGPARFLEAKRLAPPNGMAEDELTGEKLRWRVKENFDFSEFLAR